MSTLRRIRFLSSNPLKSHKYAQPLIMRWNSNQNNDNNDNHDNHDIDENVNDPRRRQELRQRHSYHQNTASRIHNKHMKRIEFEEKINEEWRKQREDKKAKEQNISNFTFYSTPNQNESSKTNKNAFKYSIIGITVICIIGYCFKKNVVAMANNFYKLQSMIEIEEWRDNYIGYERLQSVILSFKRKLFASEHRKQSFKDNEASINASTQNADGLYSNSTAIDLPLISHSNSHYHTSENTDLQKQIIQKFESMINEECKNVNDFFVSIQRQLIAEYSFICQKFKNMQRQSISKNNPQRIKKRKQTNSKIARTEPLHLTKSKEKKQIFSLYERLIALSNFASLNKMGFEQIMNAFYTELEIGQSEETQIIISEFEFLEYRKCSQTMNDLVIFYANQYENGDIDRGKIRLFDSISWSVSDKNESKMLWIGFKFGILVGTIIWSISLIIDTYIDHLIDDNLSVYNLTNIEYIYRSLGIILALIWFWSFNVYIFSKYRINFVFIFALNPRSRLNFLQILDVAITLSIIYFVDIALFIETDHYFGSEYAVIWPDALFIFFVLRLILPLFDQWSTRKYILQSILQCVIAPFGVVRFRDFFIGDVLTSLSKVFVDLYMSACMVIMDELKTASVDSHCLNSSFSNAMTPILISCPYWFRFMQCINRYYVTGDRLPNGFNALKYGLAINVTLMGQFHANTQIWFVCTLISSMYSMFWDIRMDWNLFPWSQRIKSYPKWWYFIAVIIDGILRFFWTFTLFPDDNPYFDGSKWSLIVIILFRTFVATAEVFRRCVWALFRIEKAHNAQKDEFRHYEYLPRIYEEASMMNVVQRRGKDTSRPSSLFREVIAMLILLLIFIVVVVVTQSDGFFFNTNDWIKTKIKAIFIVLC